MHSALLYKSRARHHDCSKDEEAERKSPSLASKYSISDVSKPKTNFHMDYYVMTRGQGMLRQNSFCVLRAIQDYTLRIFSCSANTPLPPLGARQLNHSRRAWCFEESRCAGDYKSCVRLKRAQHSDSEIGQNMGHGACRCAT